MEGAQRRILRDAAVWIIGCGIVAEADQFDPLQAENAPGFGPAPIIADHHAHDRVAPFRPYAKGGKSQIAIFEIALFELLVARAAARLDRAGQMDLAIATENFATAIDQDRAVEAAPRRCHLGVADIEADAERPGAIEQRLHGRIRHAALEVMIERFVLDEPSREERRERQFGIYNQARAARRRGFQELQHPAKRVFSRISLLRRPHLSGGGAENTSQYCLQSVRIAYPRGGWAAPTALRCIRDYAEARRQLQSFVL